MTSLKTQLGAWIYRLQGKNPLVGDTPPISSGC
jgi:hypothetical protein